MTRPAHKQWYTNAVVQQARVAFVNWWTAQFKNPAYCWTLGVMNLWNSGSYKHFMDGRRAMPMEVWKAFTDPHGGEQGTGTRIYKLWGPDLVATGDALHALTIHPVNVGREAREAWVEQAVKRPAAALDRIEALVAEWEFEEGEAPQAKPIRAALAEIREYMTGLRTE